MRKTWIKIGLIAAVAAASWAGNLWYFRSQQLGEALFLNHQIEVNEGNGDNFSLYYLEDLYPTKKLRMIQFPEHPGFRASGPNNDGERFTHQQLNRFDVVVEQPSSNENEKVEVQEPASEPLRIVAHYDDGTSETKTIGEVYVMNRPSGGKNSLVQGASAGTSTDGSGFDFYTLQRPAKLMKISSGYLKLFHDGRIEAAVDYTGAPHTVSRIESTHSYRTVKMLGLALTELQLPVSIQANGQLRLSYWVHRNKLPADAVYRILLEAQLEEQGTGHQKTLRSGAAAFITVPPSLTNEDVRDLVRERREEL